MVFPLFAMALLWDRLRLGERRLIKARPVRLRIAGRTLVTNTVNIAVAVVFAVMGGFIIYLAQSERMTGGPGFQAGFGRFLGRVFGQIETWVRPIPEAVLGLGLLALAAVFVLRTTDADIGSAMGLADCGVAVSCRRARRYRTEGVSATARPG